MLIIIISVVIVHKFIQVLKKVNFQLYAAESTSS